MSFYGFKQWKQASIKRESWGIWLGLGTKTIRLGRGNNFQMACEVSSGHKPGMLSSTQPPPPLCRHTE